jgi:Xaa-Pro aminopeptidase
MRMDERGMRRRLAAVAREIKKLGLDGGLFTSAANVTYLTGFLGEDSWALVIGRKVWLLTDSRYTEQAEDECVGCRIVERGKSTLEEAAGKILARHKSVEVFGVENTTSLAQYDLIRKKVKTRSRKMKEIVRDIRSVKEPGEIANIRKANNIGDKAIEQALKHLKAGMTEAELAGMLELEMRRFGGAAAFETIVCYGPNGSRNHHLPGTRKLRKSDTILVDFGVRYRGYCSDKTRCYAVGKVSSKFRKAYDTVARTQAAAIGAISAGARIKDVDAAARKVVKESGFPMFGHGLGHGIGLEVHEQPFLNAKAKGKLSANQVVTVEPGIYIPGKFGIRIEDDVLVTEKGCKIIDRGKKPPELLVI